VYSAKHREYQLVAKSTNSTLFFNLCYFHKVDFFHCGMPPLCPRNWRGHNANLGSTLKNFRRFTPEFVPPTSKPCRRLWLILGC